jgi:hypothetical protein
MFDCYWFCMRRNSQTEGFDDRRHAPRVDIDGRYSMRLDPCDGRKPIGCSLLDFSVTGVRLELPEDVKLPKDVHILIGNLSHNARVVWRKGVLVGVDFVDEHHSIY